MIDLKLWNEEDGAMTFPMVPSAVDAYIWCKLFKELATRDDQQPCSTSAFWTGSVHVTTGKKKLAVYNYCTQKIMFWGLFDKCLARFAESSNFRSNLRPRRCGCPQDPVGYDDHPQRKSNVLKRSFRHDGMTTNIVLIWNIWRLKCINKNLYIHIFIIINTYIICHDSI